MPSTKAKHLRRPHVATGTLALLALLASIAGLAPNCAIAETPALPQIAALLPLSGPHKDLGQAARDGLEWARDALPMPVELIVHDSLGTPEGAAQAVDTLATMHPNLIAIIGPIGQIESAAAAARAMELAIPILLLTSAENSEDATQGVFRLRLSPEAQARALGTFTVHQLNATQAAIFYPDNAYGTTCAQAYAAALLQAGGTLHAIEAYPPRQPNDATAAELLTGKRTRQLTTTSQSPTPKASTQRHKKAQIAFDVLFIPDNASRVVRVLSALKAAGWPTSKIQLLGTSAWLAGSLRGTTAATGALILDICDLQRDQPSRDRYDDFYATFDRPPTELEGQAHDALLVAVSALRRCPRAPSRECLLQALKSGATWPGVCGGFRLNPQGAILRDVFVYEVDDQGRPWPTQ